MAKALADFVVRARALVLAPGYLCSTWGSSCGREAPCPVHRAIAEALKTAYDEGLRDSGAVAGAPRLTSKGVEPRA